MSLLARHRSEVAFQQLAVQATLIGGILCLISTTFWSGMALPAIALLIASSGEGKKFDKLRAVLKRAEERAVEDQLSEEIWREIHHPEPKPEELPPTPIATRIGF